jgi:hypothetical protein
MNRIKLLSSEVSVIGLSKSIYTTTFFANQKCHAPYFIVLWCRERATCTKDLRIQNSLLSSWARGIAGCVWSQSVNVQLSSSHVHSSPSATPAELFKHNFLTDITTHHYGFRSQTPENQGIYSQSLFQQREGQSCISGSVLTRLSLRYVSLMLNSDAHDESPTTLPANASSDRVVDAASASASTPRIIIREASLQGKENLYSALA